MVVIVSDIVEGDGVKYVISKAGVDNSKTFLNCRCEMQFWIW